MADSRVPEVKSGNTNPTTTVPPPEDQRPSLNFACIKASDKNFLPLLGRGTDALNLVEWRKQATVYPGLLVREVKEDFSNIHGYTIGEERTYTVFGTTKSQNRTVSGDITAGGAAAGVPVTASLKTSTSKSKKENLILAEQVIVNRMYAFKVEFPTSFPTAFESDLYKWLAEHLHSFIYTPKDGLNKDYVAGITEGSEEWLEIEACIEEYIAKNAVTDYVFSIALGVKDTARSHSMKQRKEVSGGGSVGATETATVGVNVQDTITTSENQRERKTIGRVEVEEETGSLSVQKVGVVKAGIGGIGDLVQSAKIRRMVEKKAMEYKIRKRYPRYVISCNQRDPERTEPRKVFWQVKDSGVVGGTTDGENASYFYLEDKGAGKFCIYYYSEVCNPKHQDWRSKRLYFRRSKLPNTEIRVAESSWEYDDVQDLLFEIGPRFSDLGLCSVDDWHKEKKMVYLTVSNGRFRCWSETFYLQMNHDTLSFASAKGICHSSSLLFFCAEPPKDPSSS